jgi:hypothetical protein
MLYYPAGLLSCRAFYTLRFPQYTGSRPMKSNQEKEHQY